MKKIILMIGILVILLISGCEEKVKVTDICDTDVTNMDCDTMLVCDNKCEDLGLITWQLSCHAKYTNRIIAKCK